MHLVRPLVDRDRINSANRKAVATATAAIFDRIQTRPKEEQLLALCAAFKLLIDAACYPAQDAMEAASNLMRDPRHPMRMEHRFAAMKYHLETEVLKDD